MANNIIDVSSNNGEIDWKKVKNDGVTDVIIRLSLGYNDKDKSAIKFAKGANNAGLRVSYYHLAYPDKKPGNFQDDAKQEAGYFTSLFKGGLLPAPYWLAIDLEKMANGWDTPLNKSEYLDWLIIFINEVYKTTGIICMIYSNKFYLDDHLPSNHKLGQMPLWISNYNNISKPPLPIGWTQYYLWQYTSSGTVNGITTSVDMNKLYHSVQLEKLTVQLMNRKKVTGSV